VGEALGVRLGDESRADEPDPDVSHAATLQERRRPENWG
jgi:hypothetical protein